MPTVMLHARADAHLPKPSRTRRVVATLPGARPVLDLVIIGPHDGGLVLGLISEFDVRVGSQPSAADCTLILATADGYTRALTAILHRSAAPVVLVLTGGGAVDLDDAMRRGAADVVLRPCEPAEVTARVRAAIWRVRGCSPNLIRVAGIEIDPQTRLVRRGTKEVTLSPTECALLISVARRGGQVVSSKTLAREIWGENTSLASLHTYVSYLRRKVDDPSCGSVVRTVRGVGYAIGR